MDESIVQVARALACRTRLRLLSCLARGEELAPTALADKLKLPLYAVSAHVRRLVAAGLIQQRHSGVWAYCQPRSPFGPRSFSGQVSAWVFGLLKRPQAALDDSGVAQLRNHSSPETQLHAMLFETATAFGNLRRLQVLRHLTQHAAGSAVSLSDTLKMSEAAVWRHTDKLIRRGYVSCAKTKRMTCYELRKSFTSPLHAQFFSLVQHTWHQASFRSCATPK